MKNKYLRFAAIAAACMTVSTTFVSCGQADGGNYTNHADNKNAAVPSSVDSAEEEVFYDEAGESIDIDSEIPQNSEEYKYVEESGFKDAEAEPLSTFSADVDTASYSNARRYINDYTKPPEESIRVEEFVNYFDYNYPDPENDLAFGENVEITDCPWNSSNKLMKIGIQGKRIPQENLPPSNLVFLIDSSGSMDNPDKLPLVQSAFSMLAENLTENDRISIVTYAGSSSTLIKGADGSKKEEILDALYSIIADGGTNGEGGIETAYELAQEYFIEGGNNRVILATDGDLNIGRSSESELKELIEQKRDKGIYLSVLGFGTGNYKDSRMEALADNGNGNYAYIDSVDEARRVLVKEMSGTLFTIAKDMKIQVEFNPAQISKYRLIGYDNRIMNAEDFYDNKKDAGEIGSGHNVTALYEIETADGTANSDIELEFADEHTTQPAEENADNEQRKEICKVSVTYKDIDTNEDIYDSKLYGMETYKAEPSDETILAGMAAEFAMILKNSEYKGDSSIDAVLENLRKLHIEDEKTLEFIELAEKASHLYS